VGSKSLSRPLSARAEHVWNWSRERCGTVEMAHSVMKRDLAAGVMPSGRFQANAAWHRLNVLTNNLLCAMKILALPRKMELMRPEALRYRLLNLAGRVVRSGRPVPERPHRSGLRSPRISSSHT
jgi:hypothetical protein